MSSTFRARVRSALANEALQEALDRNADRRKAAWEAAFDSLPGAQESRREARRIRAESLDRLDDLLAEFRRNLEANGFQVHVAADADQACGQVVAIARAHGARLAAKSKSMVSEEIGLNAALQRAGIRAVETDLGEFIVQLRDEPPAHIITPAIHLRRQDVGRTLSEKLGVPFTTDVSEMTAAARAALRKVFLEADIGISGVNFGVAETGTLCLITNEGNGRFVTTVPPVHIALMGMERLVPTLSDLARMLEVLPRAATGQNISSYVTLLHSPRRRGDAEGPLERHILLIDNGRLRLRQSAIAEALVCVRCGACLNACPVYREAGGHAYGSVYPGPIGSVVSPGLFGLAAFGHLASASTLCGACREACPVDIDLPGLLLRVRNAHHEASPRAGIWKSSAMRVFTWVMTSPGRYRLAQRLATMSMRLLPRTSGWIRWLPPPLATWTRRRAFPPFASAPFRSRWPSLVMAPARRPAERTRERVPTIRILSLSKDAASMALGKPLSERFEASLTSVGGELVRTNSESLVDDLLAVLDRSKVGSILAAREIEADMTRWLDALRGGGRRVVQWMQIPGDKNARVDALKTVDEIEAGLTAAEAALADTGSLVLLAGEGRSHLPSLLPRLHLAILPASRVFHSMRDWLEKDGETRLRGTSQAVIITGPSRTADIEMTLTVGVHGPARLVVLLVKDEQKTVRPPGPHPCPSPPSVTFGRGAGEGTRSRKLEACGTELVPRPSRLRTGPARAVGEGRGDGLA